MPSYDYQCEEHGIFTIERGMFDDRQRHCPICKEVLRRKYHIIDDIWYCGGAHKTDYDKYGHRLERFNQHWSEMTGEEPPPPDSSVPKNLKDKV